MELLQNCDNSIFEVSRNNTDVGTYTELCDYGGSMGKQRKKRAKQLFVICNIMLSGIFILFMICIILGKLFGGNNSTILDKILPTKKVKEVEVVEQLLTPNEYSRPQDPLKKVKGIVVHYTANPGSDAEANRNYFEGLKDSHATSVSSHYIIGLDGTIIQCIPLNEIAYASNNRNVDTIAIECCHLDETGEFTKETYDALIRLVAWLCGEYNLKKEDVIRHYDILGKDCPRYYVTNPDQWQQLKEDVFTYIEENAVK